MLIRTTLFAVAAACVSPVTPALADTPDSAARCEETSFRIYFSHDSAELDAATTDMLRAAAQRVAACDYRELHVALDPQSPHARQRGAAISAAIEGADWDATRIEARRPPGDASYNAGPEYAEVRMTPNSVTAPTRPLPDTNEPSV